MSNPLHLTPGHTYRVIKSFTDYDKHIHAIGETWVFVETNFSPHDNGLSLMVTEDGKSTGYRLQWQEDEQGEIIENFHSYVELVPGIGGRAPSQ